MSEEQQVDPLLANPFTNEVRGVVIDFNGCHVKLSEESKNMAIEAGRKVASRLNDCAMRAIVESLREEDQ